MSQSSSLSIALASTTCMSSEPLSTKSVNRKMEARKEKKH